MFFFGGVTREAETGEIFKFLWYDLGTRDERIFCIYGSCFLDFLDGFFNLVFHLSSGCLEVTIVIGLRRHDRSILR